MAPDHWRGKPQGASADQFALAVIAYEMLFGHLPFESSDTDVLKKAVLEKPAEPIDSPPHATNRALRRALAKNPKDRFASCVDFVDALGGTRLRLSLSGKSYTRQLVAGLVLVTLLTSVFFYMRRQGLLNENWLTDFDIAKGTEAEKTTESAEPSRETTTCGSGDCVLPPRGLRE